MLPSDADIDSHWIECICRLLLRIQGLRHGGAVLITPDTSLKGLNIKYALQYDRLFRAIETQPLSSLQKYFASDVIGQDYLDQDSDEIPAGLYLDETCFESDLEENRSELNGVLWFIALLSRLDGLILLDQDLRVKGFGVEITVAKKPLTVWMAGNRGATRKALRRIDYDQYGTRHRSMMRYCAQVPGSIGFVISQDGDVRPITMVNKQLVVWENLRLQYHDFLRLKSSSRVTSKIA